MVNDPEVITNGIHDITDNQPQLVPGRWFDIFLYLGGSFGAYLLTSFALFLIIPEINLITTLLATLLNFLCFAGGVYVFGVLRKKITWEGIGLIPPKDLRASLLGGAGLAVILTAFRFLLMLVLIVITGDNMESLAGREALINAGMDTWYGIVLNLAGIGILAPIAEELLFRGLIYDWFRQKMPIWAAVLFSSVLFGMGHFDSWLVMLPAFIMGVALALAYQYSKTIWLPIAVHIFTNSGVVLLMAVLSRVEDLIPELGIFTFLGSNFLTLLN